MAAKIHHLNCGSMCPAGGKLITGEGGFTGAEVVCHCLLIETGDSLVLIETGVGSADMEHLARRMGLMFTAVLRPRSRPNETAIARVKALGHDPADVRHIACTHLDLDHAGGLPDFPWADVHVFEPELNAALNPGWDEKLRYRRGHFEHGPKWTKYTTGGDTWNGFESIRVMPDVDEEILLIPLTGHSRGHCAIAVRDGDGWLLHCGDAYFNHGQVETPPHCPPMILAFQKLMAADGKARQRNLERLQELARTKSDEVRLICAHDPADLRKEQAAA